MPGVTLVGMELTGRDFDRIPRGNVRVPTVEFARLWLAAERLYERDRTWANFGVVQTCRWLATATVRPEGRAWYPADAPITRRFGSAYEEAIEEEALAAAKLLGRRPVPYWLTKRPGWLLAVHATFEWAWHRYGNPPIEVPAPAPARD
ncbi:hypothetical protein HFP15_19090 [Amycolatopsis sp. K13G38]|uniref:Uncharacterized protein n=1 Tax=Amycolatopsis acididurans TaxID=2724524 RepID=A0ABX1J5C1_9PSEU|nr:hypothetical protein [Amycolatopsis acididurans]NKQ54992.1 hypothetical protein [Amycolatopsis acididurans]